MDVIVKILPIIVVALLLFAAKEGYAIYRYVKQCKLHEAAKAGRIDEVVRYLKMGHPVNAVDPRFGLTPLHLAVRNGRVEVAKLLIRHGAGMDDPSLQGITPRQWARQYLSPEANKELQNLSMEMRDQQKVSTTMKS